MSQTAYWDRMRLFAKEVDSSVGKLIDDVLKHEFGGAHLAPGLGTETVDSAEITEELEPLRGTPAVGVAWLLPAADVPGTENVFEWLMRGSPRYLVPRRLGTGDPASLHEVPIVMLAAVLEVDPELDGEALVAGMHHQHDKRPDI